MTESELGVQILTNRNVKGISKEDLDAMFNEIDKYKKYDRPEYLEGPTVCSKTSCGNLYVTCNFDGSSFVELFARLGKAGNCQGAFLEALCKTVSLALQNGVDPMKIARNIQGIKCPNPVPGGNSQIQSCPDAIGKVMCEMIQKRREEYNFMTTMVLDREIVHKGNGKSNGKGNGTCSSEACSECVKEPTNGKGKEIKNQQPSYGVCPDCQSALIKIEGCVGCSSRCGYSLC